MLDNNTVNKLIQKQLCLLKGKQLFDVELTSRCNKKCPMCPRENLQRKVQDMDEYVFRVLAEWIPDHCYVMFAGLGEPLLNKNVYEYLKILKALKKHCVVSLYTNGILLNRDVIQELFFSGLDLLQVSITCAENLDLCEKVIHFFNKKNIDNLLRFNILYQNEKELVDMQKIISQKYVGLKNNFFFKKMHNRGGLLFDEKWDNDVQTCGTFFMDTFVDCEGNIQICSNDVNGQNCIGNITTMSFSDLMKFKSKFIGNVGIAPLCSNCSDEYRKKHFEEVSYE